MIKMSVLENTILMNSTIHGVALGFLVISFRKATPLTPEFWANVATIKAVAKRAKALEAALPLTSNYAEILQQAKTEVYSPRHACKRATGTVIYSVREEKDTLSAGTAWDILLNGQGTSVKTGKHIKRIVCLEKRRKVAVRFAELLAR